jgi:hypothetical protein
VKDAQGEPAYGRTNWRRFAVAVGVPTVAAGALVVGLANGAFAASLTLSGQAFKISADKLVATGFVQYSGAYANGQDATKPLGAAVSGIKHADLYNLCQSVHPAGAPFSLVIRAGRDDRHPAQADNMIIGMSELSGEATFHGIEIGKDASTVTKGGDNAKGGAGTFAQEADDVTISGLHQTAYYTQASTFTLTGLSLSLKTDWKNKAPEECFQD